MTALHERQHERYLDKSVQTYKEGHAHWWDNEKSKQLMNITIKDVEFLKRSNSIQQRKFCQNLEI